MRITGEELLYRCEEAKLRCPGSKWLIEHYVSELKSESAKLPTDRWSPYTDRERFVLRALLTII